MYYAANGKISTNTIEGGIQITPTEYADAIAAMQEGKRLTIAGGQMVLAFAPEPEPKPEPEVEHTPEKLYALARADRAAAFRNEADPLFFKWQRGEGAEQDWLDKVAEIRQRYPYPDGSGNEGGAP